MKHAQFYTLGVLLFITFAVCGPLFAQNTDRDLFLDAEARFQGGNVSLALEQYDELIRKWPDSPYSGDARYRRAIILYRMGKLQEAYRAFEAIEKRYRSTKFMAYIPYWKARIEYDEKNFAKAYQLLATLSLNKLDEEIRQQALLYKGRAALALDDTEGALSAFESLYSERSSRSLQAETEGALLVYLSDLYSRLNKYEDQNRLWESLPKDTLKPEIREPLALRSAEAYLALGKSDQALSLLEALSTSSNREIAGKALQSLLSYEQKQGNDEAVASVIIKAENILRGDPKALASFWAQVGSATFYEGKLDLARAYLLRVLAIAEPGTLSQEVPIYLAEISWRQRNPKQAVTILLDAEGDIRGDKALLLSRIQWYALQQEDWDLAIDYGQKALVQAEQEGRDDIAVLAKSYLSYSLYRKHQFAQALDILGTDPVPPGPKELAKRLQSRLLQKNGQALSALESYDALIQQNPLNPEILIERMSLLFEKNQYGQVVSASDEMETKTDIEKLSAPYRFGFLYMKGISLAQTASTAEAYTTAAEVLAKALASAPSKETSIPWALYYEGWSLYRAGNFSESAKIFEQFVSLFNDHPQTYTAAYLGAWSYARQGRYEKGALLAQKAADQSSGITPEAFARSRYLEGVLRSLYADWPGALKALDQVASTQTSYAVRALFEKGNVYYRMGNIEEADTAFAAVQRNFSQEPLAEEAAYRRGELYYGVRLWRESLDRFTQYRQTYPRGKKVDGALYFSGVIQETLSQTDSAILLWERLLREYQGSSYRLPAMLALEKAYWTKQDWENALRVGTSAIVEFGEAAKSAGLEDQVATLRYLIAGMSEKAARLQVQLVKQQGVASRDGRKTALELARYYIFDSSQREAGLALADQVLAYRGEDPGLAAEAQYLKGEYYSLLEAWDKSADAYLDAIDLASPLKAGETRPDLIPEALFKAARSTLRLGNTESARRLVETLRKQYGSSPWTKQADRLMEASR